MWLIRKIRRLVSRQTGRQGRARDRQSRRLASSSKQLPRHHNTSGRSAQQQKQAVDRRQPNILQRVAFLTLLLAVIVWVAVFGWTGSVNSDIESLANQTQQRLEQTSRFRWLSGAVGLEEYLLNQNPQFSSISITQPLLSRSMTVDGELKQPVLQWRSGGRTVTLSSDGVAIARIDAPLKGVPLISDETNLNYKPGDRVASPQLVEFLTELSALDGEPLSFAAITLSNSRAVRVSLTDNDFRLLLATDIDPNAQIESVQQLLEQGSSPQRYVDMTVPGRLFWQ